MEHDLSHTTALLARTPAALEALLRDLPSAWTVPNEGGDSWSATDVVGHLIHCERTDWVPRVRIILEFGENRVFDSFDRLGYVAEIKGKSLEQLLRDFSGLRSDNLRELRALNLKQEDLDRRGQHPALGVVTLSQLLATWVVHDLTHLHQISRVMAGQYSDAVGPWRVYLGVLQCQGHSS
ncbi:MAG: DinB family protein [Terriglobales bacterium]